MTGYIGKGNWNEWETARALSKWLTDGTDKTQLIRSVQSGGNIVLRDAALYQVGDLAPNGPKGEEFRRHFGVECKNYAKDPEWWHAFSSKNWIVAQWWWKIVKECEPHMLEPLLIMKRNRCTTVVMMHRALSYRAVSSFSAPRPTLILPFLDAAVYSFGEFMSVKPWDWYKAKGGVVLVTSEGQRVEGESFTVVPK